MFNNIKF